MDRDRFYQWCTLFGLLLFISWLIACVSPWTPAEQAGSPNVIAHQGISVDVSLRVVQAEYFVAAVEDGIPEDFYYEVYDERMEDAWWMEELHVSCDDIFESVHLWVRVLDGVNSSVPVETYVIISDSNGQCGWPQLNEGPNEHEEDGS